MELIDQRTKKIMEECKYRALDAGLSFNTETLEYIVTNRDMLELSPKNMIPTLYDFWVHDLNVFKGRKVYELYPYNPFETVINTRPAISFYNDNNPDWLNVMIFYHVIGHIDFFQNNTLFKHTWNDDFAGIALADKRLISKYRSEKGRWVDYVIEFARSIDNLVGYHDLLSDLYNHDTLKSEEKINFYFDIFLSRIKKVKSSRYLKEIERFNKCKGEFPDMYRSIFFTEVEKDYPEFEELYTKEQKEKKYRDNNNSDLISYISDNSRFLNDKENEWMKSVLEIVRKTSLYFEPQRRTKIFNEGWASYWHELLFLDDDRIKGHEVDFARINSQVLPMPRAGLNPYSLGWRLLLYIKELSDKGKISYDFQKIKNFQERKNYNKNTGEGLEYLFWIRENYDDFILINTFVDQDFVDRYNLFVVGKRLNPDKGIWEYYVKSRDAERYRKMLIDSLYHPPHITIDESKSGKELLYLNHSFEGKTLVKEYIKNTMMGIEYLYGGEIRLETSEVDEKDIKLSGDDLSYDSEYEPEYKRIVYRMKNRKLTREVI